MLNVRMVKIADKYFVKPLRDLAMQKLKSGIATDWDKAVFGEAITMAYGKWSSPQNFHYACQSCKHEQMR